MPTESSATIEGPSLSESSPRSSLDSLPVEPVEPNDPHRKDSSDPLTDQQDEVLKLSMGMGTLSALQSIDANEVQNRAEREYVDGNMELWRKNWGLTAPTSSAKDKDVAGHTVRVDSDDKHYHWHLPPAPVKPTEPVKPTPPVEVKPTEPAKKPSTLSGLLPWIVAGTLGAGGVGLGLLLADKANGDPVVTSTDTDTDTDTRSTLRPYDGPD